jgi:hypothetical protein
MGYFKILAAIPGFFLSSWFLMLLWGIIAPKVGWSGIDYPVAMLINITLWLAVAPLAAAAGRVGRIWRSRSSFSSTKA